MTQHVALNRERMLIGSCPPAAHGRVRCSLAEPRIMHILRPFLLSGREDHQLASQIKVNIVSCLPSQCFRRSPSKVAIFTTFVLFYRVAGSTRTLPGGHPPPGSLCLRIERVRNRRIDDTGLLSVFSQNQGSRLPVQTHLTSRFFCRFGVRFIATHARYPSALGQLRLSIFGMGTIL